MRRYSVVLIPEGDQYTVKVPVLPGCVTQGDTVEDALDAARDAIGLYLESAAAHGEPVPTEEGPLQLLTVEI